jgi:SAM-dependent methyltransferase
VLRTFIDANRAATTRLRPLFPHMREDPFTTYDTIVAKLASRPEVQVVADIGGGKACVFAHLLDPATRPRLVAVDIAPEELAHNRDVDETRVADAAQGLPFADGELDMVVSKTVLEHVQGVGDFVEHAARVLRPGGYAVHLVPCRFAPFALVGKALPFDLAKGILHRLYPESIGVVEFPIFYDSCYTSALKRLHEEAGFRSTKFRWFYDQSGYFEAFLPAWLASASYEAVISALSLRNLTAYLIVVAQK